MRRANRAFSVLVPLLLLAATARAEVLVRWDQPQVPAPASLGITTLVIPANNADAIKSALRQGYRLYLEVDAAKAATFLPPDGDVVGVVVAGKVSPPQLRLLRQRAGSSRRVVTLEQGGKWPHIRSNWVTKNNNVLQVTGRSAQPWIENNAALLRIAGRARGQAVNRERGQAVNRERAS